LVSKGARGTGGGRGKGRELGREKGGEEGYASLASISRGLKGIEGSQFVFLLKLSTFLGLIV
jgi:hypothetical protein